MVDLFAGFPVADYDRSLEWYRQLFGTDPSFHPNDREAVWEVGDHCYVYFEVLPDRAGGSLSLVMVDDIDAKVSEITERGLEPLRVEQYDGGMRKVVYRDPDGNELSFGGTSGSAAGPRRASSDALGSIARAASALPSLSRSELDELADAAEALTDAIGLHRDWVGGGPGTPGSDDRS